MQQICIKNCCWQPEILAKTHQLREVGSWNPTILPRFYYTIPGFSPLTMQDGVADVTYEIRVPWMSSCYRHRCWKLGSFRKTQQGFPGDSSRDSWIYSQTFESWKGHGENHHPKKVTNWITWFLIPFFCLLPHWMFVTKNTESRHIWHTFRRWILAFLSHGIEKNKEDDAFFLVMGYSVAFRNLRSLSCCICFWNQRQEFILDTSLKTNMAMEDHHS